MYSNDDQGPITYSPRANRLQWLVQEGEPSLVLGLMVHATGARALCAYDLSYCNSPMADLGVGLGVLDVGIVEELFPELVIPVHRPLPQVSVGSCMQTSRQARIMREECYTLGRSAILYVHRRTKQF